jgi:putative transcriptional regulator
MSTKKTKSNPAGRSRLSRAAARQGPGSRATTFGQSIIAGLEEVVDALRGGEPLEKRFKVRTIEIPDPPTFTAADVKALRLKLHLNQRFFAKLVGTSTQLVEHWEQGRRAVRPTAARLMDQIRRNPARFLSELMQPTPPRRKAG